jgi:ELWxxDGT repeat protein
MLRQTVLFNGADSNNFGGLWVTNGTTAGTSELTAISGADTNPMDFGLDPLDFTLFNGKVLFNGADRNQQLGMWVTNGTAAGTSEVTGINGADPSGLAPADFTVFNNKVLFVGADAGGASGLTGLWVTNGTAAGTTEVGGFGDSGINGVNSAGLFSEIIHSSRSSATRCCFRATGPPTWACGSPTGRRSTRPSCLSPGLRHRSIPTTSRFSTTKCCLAAMTRAASVGYG